MRVLKPKGHLIFTDLMTAHDTSVELLGPAMSRVFVKPLPKLGFYLNQLADVGFADIGFHDYSPNLLTHYIRLTEETKKCGAELAAAVSSSYRDSLLENLSLWVNACQDGQIRWGVFHCRRD
jgi:sarcosine/dimethylglycine N-methyltransferase